MDIFAPSGCSLKDDGDAPYVIAVSTLPMLPIDTDGVAAMVLKEMGIVNLRLLSKVDTAIMLAAAHLAMLCLPCEGMRARCPMK
jgi:hypothetical protein